MTADLVARDLHSAAAHHRAGRLDKAETLYRKILKRQPGHAEALNMLGLIALVRGRSQRAVQLMTKAVRSNPRNAGALSNLGNAMFATGAYAEAIVRYRQAMAVAPKDPNPVYNLALALRALKRASEAEPMMRAALVLKPEALDWRRELALTLMELDRQDEALAVLDELHAMRPDNIADLMVRAAVLYRMSEFASSEALYRRGGELTPDDPDVWNGLGLCARAMGRFDEAASAFLRARDLAPSRADAYRNLGSIGRLPPSDAPKLTAIARDHHAPVLDRVVAGFALGRLHDEAEQYEEAFEAFSAANTLFLEISGRQFDRAAFAADVDRIINQPIEETAAASSDIPVLVVGAPRSGTSLVEQIAASHPLVHGAGELKDLGRIVAAGDRGAELAREHLDRLRRTGAARVIDKMPDNIFLLGHIAARFPGARIVFCRRDPRDTCLSCYFTLFASGNLYSYDLDDCAQRLRHTDRLMRHWQQRLPLAMLTIDYENVVGDLEGEARKLIAFLGLEWHPACLEFHRTQRPVTTSSNWQVRQPLYARSIGRWRHYARHLEGIEFEA